MVEGVGEETASANRPTVFISYASQDAAVANVVVGALERAGLDCWIAPRDVVPGALYADEIVRAINDSSLVVLVLSAQSVASSHVGKELERASSKRRRIIALRTDAAALPHAFEYFLSESQWIEVGAAGIEPAAAKIAEAVRRYLGSELKSSANDSQAPSAARNTTVTTDSPMERMPSIAVLPFANMSGDKEQEYFSDGLAEEIINALAQISGLRVIARTSAFAFKGQNTDIREIARTLGVAHVLEGSVRRSGNRIRVTAQLVTASNGSHLWSERYDREMADVFAVQDEISAAISAALKVRLTPQAPAVPRHTPTLPAYEALLKARYFHWKVTAESMDQAKVFYEQAIALDPQFAMAHATYAEYLFGRTTASLSNMRELAPVIRALALRALELDPSFADAHGPLCALAATYDYDWDEAGRQAALAAPGGVGSPVSHLIAGYFYVLGAGRREEAVTHLELAVKGDPLHLMYRTVLAACLGAVGRYAEALELLKQSLDLDRNFFWTNFFLSVLYAETQMFAEALPFAERTFAIAPWYLPGVGAYAGLLVRMDRRERAKVVFQTLGTDEKYGAALGMAIFHTWCGEIDLAAGCFEKAICERDSEVVVLLQGMIGEPLRASAHWPRLAALMNLPEAAMPAT